MSQVTNTHTTPTRRNALRSTAATVLADAIAPVPAGATTPDANLIALCAEAARCEERIRCIDQQGTVPNRECQDACTTWHETYRQIANLPAVTLAGIQAKARILDLAVVRETVWSDGFDENLAGTSAITRYLRSDGRIARSLVADCLALETLA